MTWKIMKLCKMCWVIYFYLYIALQKFGVSKTKNKQKFGLNLKKNYKNIFVTWNKLNLKKNKMDLWI